MPEYYLFILSVKNAFFLCNFGMKRWYVVGDSCQRMMLAGMGFCVVLFVSARWLRFFILPLWYRLCLLLAFLSLRVWVYFLFL